MDEYQNLTVLKLRELLWEKELVPSRWMLTYIKKDEALLLLRRDKSVPTKFIDILRERQRQHLSKAMTAQKDRADQFGITLLTTEERVRRIVAANPNLKYVERRHCPDGFTSSVLSRRGKLALVFVSEEGEEFLFTKGEAQQGQPFGLSVPSDAFKLEKKIPDAANKSGKTPKDIFK